MCFIWSILVNVPCKLKKNEYSAIVGYNVLLMFIWAIRWTMEFWNSTKYIYIFGLLHFLDELNFLLLYFVPISLAIFFVLKSSRFQIWFNRPIQDLFLINVLMKKYIGSHDFFLKQTTSLNSKWFSYSQLIFGSFKKLLCESLDHLYVT